MGSRGQQRCVQENNVLRPKLNPTSILQCLSQAWARSGNGAAWPERQLVHHIQIQLQQNEKTTCSYL